VDITPKLTAQEAAEAFEAILRGAQLATPAQDMADEGDYFNQRL